MSPTPIHDDASEWQVLIVDDEPDSLGVPLKILTFYGAQVYTAEDGAAGMTILEEVTPSFILLDLSMPNMDGWQMIQEIRSKPATAGVPVIALTAHAMAGDEERAKAAGFDGYITKPFRLESFFDQIKVCLRQLA